MPNNSVISEGNTTNEAIENGLKILNVSQDMVNVKVLETEKKSFFSILAPRVVKVELTLKDEKEIGQAKKETNETNIKKEIKNVTPEKLVEAEKNVKVFLDKFLNNIGNNISYKTEKKPTGIQIYISGEEAGFLIGYRGDTLYALQSVVSTIANKNIDEKIRVWLDIEGYKERREKTLQDLALKIAKTVERTIKYKNGQPVSYKEKYDETSTTKRLGNSYNDFIESSIVE